MTVITPGPVWLLSTHGCLTMKRPATRRSIAASTSRIRAKCDIVINNSTGGGVHGDAHDPADRRRHVADTFSIWEERLKGMEAGAEMCTLDACTFVASFGGKEVLLNTSPSRCRYLAEEMKKRGIKPEWEVFSPTHIVQDATTLIQLGLDEPPYAINMVMNAHRGFQNAMPTITPSHCSTWLIYCRRTASSA